MGIDHVGIGLDLDGGGGVLGMNDVSEMPNITKELIARGAEGLGGNKKRALPGKLARRLSRSA